MKNLVKIKTQLSEAPIVVLIVDDEPEIRESLKEILSENGYQAFTARNGNEGKKMYDELSVDLVITDIYMPNQDGIGLIRELKKMNPDVKILAISGGGRGQHFDSLEWAEALGANGSLIKPFDHLHLLDAVEKMLHQQVMSYD